MNVVDLFSLAHLTVPDLSPIDAVRVAADAGYSRLGLRLLPAVAGEPLFPLISDPRLLREVRAAVDAEGIAVGDLELIRIGPGTRAEDFLRFFDAGAVLGATDVIVINDDPDFARAACSLAALSELAGSFGLSLNLEPIPWTALRDLADALQMVEAADKANLGILVDAFHFHRRGTPLSELSAVSPRLLRIFQICDAPQYFDPAPEAIRSQARTARLLPGDGELDLPNLIRLLPAHTVISVEVPNQKMIDGWSPARRASRALEAARRVVGDALLAPPV